MLSLNPALYSLSKFMIFGTSASFDALFLFLLMFQPLYISVVAPFVCRSPTGRAI
ncbi:hypothetical protein [Vibrio vulnificus YJ016]|uniref:Uncharacterized protein n=1 Tax=Vibrio vulnificus (strain YJ016) TaxID=196600 RepID=Q7MED0_VIBVY|nr:hypothetical protein [Vibrio vulnificus YJ016]